MLETHCDVYWHQSGLPFRWWSLFLWLHKQMSSFLASRKKEEKRIWRPPVDTANTKERPPVAFTHRLLANLLFLSLSASAFYSLGSKSGLSRTSWWRWRQRRQRIRRIEWKTFHFRCLDKRIESRSDVAHIFTRRRHCCCCQSLIFVTVVTINRGERRHHKKRRDE